MERPLISLVLASFAVVLSLAPIALAQAPDGPAAPVRSVYEAQPLAELSSEGEVVEPEPWGALAPRCDEVMTKQSLCSCLAAQQGESGQEACTSAPLLAPNFDTLRTAEGSVFAIAKKGGGFYALTKLHDAGMQTFGVRGVRVRPAGDGHVLRIVTVRQEGADDFIHTTNEVVLCPITMPRTPGVACARYPLYAHTREFGFDENAERETRFQVAALDAEVLVAVRAGALEHPELAAALGKHALSAR